MVTASLRMWQFWTLLLTDLFENILTMLCLIFSCCFVFFCSFVRLFCFVFENEQTLFAWTAANIYGRLRGHSDFSLFAPPPPAKYCLLLSWRLIKLTKVLYWWAEIVKYSFLIWSFHFRCCSWVKKLLLTTYTNACFSHTVSLQITFSYMHQYFLLSVYLVTNVSFRNTDSTCKQIHILKRNVCTTRKCLKSIVQVTKDHNLDTL